MIAVGMLVGGVFAALQFMSMALYGDLARAPALPSFIVPAIGVALGRPFGGPRAPVVLRIAYARALLHRNQTAAAEAIIVGLPAGADAADLRGQLAEVRGDTAAALGWYARARDFERAQRLIDIDDVAGRYLQAGRLETQLVDVLGGDADAGIRARALWRAGQISQETAAAQLPASGAAMRRSLVLYEAALALAPNDETYLLAAGQQALTLGDRPAAARYYERALEAVPNSADARSGLARTRP